MAKTFIDFENCLIDINNIKAIEKTTSWDDINERVSFDIIINNPNRIKVDSFHPTFTFKYGSEEYRDRLHQELRERLEEEEVKFV